MYSAHSVSYSSSASVYAEDVYDIGEADLSACEMVDESEVSDAGS